MTIVNNIPTVTQFSVNLAETGTDSPTSLSESMLKAFAEKHSENENFLKDMSDQAQNIGSITDALEIQQRIAEHGVALKTIQAVVNTVPKTIETLGRGS